MPVILNTGSKLDRDVIEPIAVALQHEADRHVPAMASYIAQSMRNGVAAIDDKLLRRGIETHDLTSVVAAIPELAPSWWPVVPLVKAQNTTGNALADRLTEQFGDSARLAVSIAPRFDVVNPHAVEWAQQRAGKLLSDLDGQALMNARQAVAYGIREGRTVDETARFLKSTLYLPPRGQQAVTNYFDALIARVEKGDDLAEAARAAGKGRALAPRQFRDAQNIDTLTERYADRWVKYTAEAQARTLTIEASNAGLRGGWNEAAQAGMFDAKTATIVWYATKDDLVCPECKALDGTEVAFISGGFETTRGFTQTPPAHVNCRCTLVLITKSFNPNAQSPRLNPHTPPVTVDANAEASMSPADHASFVDALRAKHNLPNIDVLDNGDHLSVNYIGGRKGSRDALNVVKEVIEEADRRGVAVTITPGDTTSPSRTILRDLGFKSSKGKYADTLVREAGAAPRVPVPRIPRVPEPKPIPTPPAPPELKPLSDFQASLRWQHGLDDIRITDHGTHVSIDNIGATKGDGKARKVIEDVIREAEKRGISVTITPSEATSPSPTVLRNLGFKSARGEFGSDSLVWRPGDIGAPKVGRPTIPRVSRVEPAPVARVDDGRYHMTGDRVQFGTASNAKQFSDLLDQIDGVHSYAGQPEWKKQSYQYYKDRATWNRAAPVQNDKLFIYTKRLKQGTGGDFMPGQGVLRISNVGATPERQAFTFVHEFGHSLDNVMSTSQYGEYASEGIGTMTQAQRDAWSLWKQAVERSDAIANAPSYFNGRYLKYYTSKRETWARSYSQYMSRRVGGAAEDGLRFLQARAAHYQWTDIDFATSKIGDAIEGVLRAYGLLYE